MAKIGGLPNMQNLTTVEDVVRFLSRYLKDVEAAVNGGLRFTDNVKSQLLTVNFTATNTDTTFQHKMGKPITGVMDYYNQVGGSVYFGSRASTQYDVTLRCDVAGERQILLLV